MPAPYSQSELETAASTNLPDNQTGDISAADARTLITDIIGSSNIAYAQTLTDQATITWNVKSGAVGKVLLEGNRTLNAPTNARDGQMLTLIVIQDGTGSRTLTWDGFFNFPGGTAPTLTTTADRADVFNFLVHDFGGATGSKAILLNQSLDVIEYDDGSAPTELITNTTFDDSTGWTLTRFSTSGGKLVSDLFMASKTATHDTVSFSSGTTYTVSFDVDAISGTWNLQFNGTTDQTFNTTGAHSYDINPTSTGLFSILGGSSGTLTLDNMSIVVA